MGLMVGIHYNSAALTECLYVVLNRSCMCQATWVVIFISLMFYLASIARLLYLQRNRVNRRNEYKEQIEVRIHGQDERLFYTIVWAVRAHTEESYTSELCFVCRRNCFATCEESDREKRCSSQETGIGKKRCVRSCHIPLIRAFACGLSQQRQARCIAKVTATVPVQ